MFAIGLVSSASSYSSFCWGYARILSALIFLVEVIPIHWVHCLHPYVWVLWWWHQPISFCEFSFSSSFSRLENFARATALFFLSRSLCMLSVSTYCRKLQKLHSVLFVFFRSKHSKNIVAHSIEHWARDPWILGKLPPGFIIYKKITLCLFSLTFLYILTWPFTCKTSVLVYALLLKSLCSFLCAFCFIRIIFWDWMCLLSRSP